MPARWTANSRVQPGSRKEGNADILETIDLGFSGEPVSRGAILRELSAQRAPQNEKEKY